MKIKILIIMLLVLTSCQYIPGTGDKVETVDIHKGTEGVQITLINPNPNIIEEQNIFLILQLDNKGATDITDGIYNLITDRYIQLKETKGNYTLKGKTQDNPRGELNQIQIEGQSIKLPPQTEHYKTQIALQTCYGYNTKASLSVCIDTDITSKRPKPCAVKAESFSGGQGAPVAVTKIEPMMMPKVDSTIPAFQIYIKNTGKRERIKIGVIKYLTQY